MVYSYKLSAQSYAKQKDVNFCVKIIPKYFLYKKENFLNFTLRY